MKKFYKIVVLSLTLIFLTTYTPSNLNLYSNKKKGFFKINEIHILNNSLIQKEEIESKLKNIYTKNIIFINKEDVEKPLKSIDFLDKIEVKKKYPNEIIIEVFETKPLAVIFKKNKKYLIDNNSNLILYIENKDFKQLPNIFGGEGVEKKFLIFFNKLKNESFPISKIKNFYFFQIGRWDIQLRDDRIIKYPSTNIIKSIHQSVEYLSREDFKKYNIIDLRIDGKVIVE